MPVRSSLAVLLGTLLLLLGAAPPQSPIPQGHEVVLFDVHPADAAFPARAMLVGQSCTVGSGGLTPTDRGWFAGSVSCEDGDRTFSRFSFELAKPLPAPADSGCPAGAYTGEPIPDGSDVTVLAVGTADAWYGERATIEGIAGKVRGDLHDGKQDGGCWMSGGVTTADGSELYLHAIAIKLDKKFVPKDPIPDGRSCPSGASYDYRYDDGTSVKLLSIHPDDAYYSLRGRYIGTSGVVTGDLHNNGDCWYGGGFTSDSGEYFYFYKAAIKAGKPKPSDCPRGVVTSSSGVYDGGRVKIFDISADDAYYSTRYSIIGLAGRVEGGLSKTGECWYGGGFTADNGTYYYFYQAMVVEQDPVPVPDPGGGGCSVTYYAGGPISSGTSFVICDLHTDDAYYSSRYTYIGLSCYATGDMTEFEYGYYGGPAMCSGYDMYFYKVKVAPP